LRSLLRKIVFSVAALILFCLAAELTARLVGARFAGTAPQPIKSPIDFQQMPRPFFELEPNNHRLFMRNDVNRRPYLRYPKSGNEFRVFAFGGSATAGMGFPYNGSFSRWLERMLQAAYPGREVEVVNMGRVGYSTEQVKVLLDEVLEKAEPDLLVVYSGHNEFLDVKARLALAGPPASQLSDWLDRHSAAIRFARGLLPARKFTDAERSKILRDYIFLPLSPRQIQDALARYRRNLTEMAQAAKKRRVPLVVCTLLANPLPDAFDSPFVDEQTPADDKLLVSQAIGWARLGRWDKAEQNLRSLSTPRPRYELLRVFEAGGVGGIERLSPEARRALAEAAPAAIREVGQRSVKRLNDLFVLALAQRLSGDAVAVSATLQRMDFNIEQSAGGANQMVWRVLRDQLIDQKTFERTFREVWANYNNLICALPASNAIIRSVAAREGLALADVESKLSDWLDPSPERYLLDYCHLNIEGAFEVARVIFETAREKNLLPPRGQSVDFRNSLLKPALTYLRTTGHDFTERDLYFGLDFRVCFVYAQPFPNNKDFARWFAEDARREPDRQAVEALARNRRWYEGH
jgi:lysophospholipase L1-like esterase